MAFTYEELREYVREDFERFYALGFQEDQILPAVLDEYKYGKDFVLQRIFVSMFFSN